LIAIKFIKKIYGTSFYETNNLVMSGYLETPGLMIQGYISSSRDTSYYKLHCLWTNDIVLPQLRAGRTIVKLSNEVSPVFPNQWTKVLW